jgi:hypothetical protein
LGISKCTQLRTLHLCGSNDVTDAAVVQLAKALPQLVSLDLSYAGDVGDAGVTALAEHLPNLTILRLNGLERLSPFGVAALSKSPCGQRLRVLELHCCRKICWPVPLLPLLNTWFPRLPPVGWPVAADVRASIYGRALRALAPEAKENAAAAYAANAANGGNSNGNSNSNSNDNGNSNSNGNGNGNGDSMDVDGAAVSTTTTTTTTAKAMTTAVSVTKSPYCFAYPPFTDVAHNTVVDLSNTMGHRRQSSILQQKSAVFTKPADVIVR